MTPTAARPTTDSRSHWYTKGGTPFHTVTAKGNGQPRPTTLRDARELDLIPSVTNILRTIRKPHLESWITEQACLAVLTAPRQGGEALDAFVQRILQTERHQDQERDTAADLGSQIHAALADALSGMSVVGLRQYIQPVLDFLSDRKVIATEQVVVGRGYAGTVDLLTTHLEYFPLLEKNLTIEGHLDVWDFKTTKSTLPDKAWPDHRLQLAAYSEAIEHGEVYSVADTYNVYISTTEPGKFQVCKNPSWIRDFHDGFEHILEYWQWANNFRPKKVTSYTEFIMTGGRP